jgi:hypothetical protein
MNEELLEKIKKHLGRDDGYDGHSSPQFAIRNHVGYYINSAKNATDLETAIKRIKKARENFAVIVSTGIINREWVFHVYRAIDKMENRVILQHTSWRH